MCHALCDGLVKNRTIRYLNISHNCFESPDFMVAAKLGRIVVGHPKIAHIDLSYLMLRREECLFLVT